MPVGILFGVAQGGKYAFDDFPNLRERSRKRKVTEVCKSRMFAEVGIVSANLLQMRTYRTYDRTYVGTS